MTGVLQLLALVVVAIVATFLLDRGGRQGYGWVTGSEFLVAGLLLGPVGLDLVSADLIEAARSLLIIATSWLGLRLGLRMCRSEVSFQSWRSILSSQAEPLVALLALRGLLALSSRIFHWPTSSWAAWLLAAIGATSTKSAIAWVKSRHRAEGPLSDALAIITELNDVPSVLLLGVLFAFQPDVPRILPGHAWGPIVATAALALGVALLVHLVMGRTRFKEDLAWVALAGACALLAGAGERLGLQAIVVCTLAGIFLGLLSPHRDALEQITRTTERPVVQVLLVLGGASIQPIPAALLAGLAFAGLRIASKWVGGGVVGTVLRPSGRMAPQLGAGLLAGGGMAFALALATSLKLSAELANVVLCAAAAMIILGDLVGSSTLKWMLRRAGELPAGTEGGTAEVRP